MIVEIENKKDVSNQRKTKLSNSFRLSLEQKIKVVLVMHDGIFADYPHMFSSRICDELFSLFFVR